MCLPIIASRNICRPFCHHLLDRVALTATHWPTNSHPTTMPRACWCQLEQIKSRASQLPSPLGDQLTATLHQHWSHYEHSGLLRELGLLSYTRWRLWLWSAVDDITIIDRKPHLSDTNLSSQITSMPKVSKQNWAMGTGLWEHNNQLNGLQWWQLFSLVG